MYYPYNRATKAPANASTAPPTTSFLEPAPDCLKVADADALELATWLVAVAIVVLDLTAVDEVE